MAYVDRGESGFSLNQHTIASMSWLTVGALCGRQIMSPRLMSISSARRIVTLIGEEASSIGPPNWSTEATVVLKPDGSTRTSSPARNWPPATCPA